MGKENLKLDKTQNLRFSTECLILNAGFYLDRGLVVDMLMIVHLIAQFEFEFNVRCIL